jgi:hypothetical protein
MRLAVGLTGRTGARSHLAPVRGDALGGGGPTSRVRRGRVLPGTAPCRTPLGDRVAARFDACLLQEPREEVARKSFRGDDGGSSPGNEGGELPPTGVGCRRPSPHSRLSRLRGRSFNCDLGATCKISRLFRWGNLILRAAGRPCKRQSATYGVPRLHTADRVGEARRTVSEAACRPRPVRLRFDTGGWFGAPVRHGRRRTAFVEERDILAG